VTLEQSRLQQRHNNASANPNKELDPDTLGDVLPAASGVIFFMLYRTDGR
jgi:hypothetical protein